MEEERRKLEEQKFEEQKHKEEQHKKEEKERQEKLMAEYQASQPEVPPQDELDKCESFELPKEKDEEEKNVSENKEEPIFSTLSMTESASATEQFLAILLNPATPASKRRELLMAYVC
eukprot:TRINITY_DN1313_c0_g3_i4.p5 TRINITY_DN1313_c0_g3~~TRINITY_DN1313_c0_g3_i4.p5  ORF type:complete len:118 (-),score=47.27 TRINITY_DN1313_c0_g3_i4:982-1335(-)